MAFHIRDPETDALVRKLAQLRGVGLTEAIHDAVEEALKRERAKTPLWERLQPIAERLRAHEDTGLPADKAFFDDLSGI
ncbi:type II toxin-antitoxin system VapB family antitoxin [Ancylobacter sp. 6x-1]|uniref:Type II toxin-antitoxin system VapB family antitoxin n=1 Tax=Ancylobacter crimeensis TaxID=2579147 RepID=A0ABT0D874_9HYPH|nr:type II toxin-antitoxin system VapB family antitoxin [Ancylobacter crimeensis]MCK0196152.1 type II toxin-antitoxin system VapB family antitoxin [Ancylobacter crimeensis]